MYKGSQVKKKNGKYSRKLFKRRKTLYIKENRKVGSYFSHGKSLRNIKRKRNAKTKKC